MMRICAATRAYVAFAVTKPARYQLMFSAELAASEDPALCAAISNVRDVIDRLTVSAVRSGRQRPAAYPTLALAVWSLAHGLSTLLLNGWVGYAPVCAKTTDDLAEVAARNLLRSLGVAKGS